MSDALRRALGTLLVIGGVSAFLIQQAHRTPAPLPESAPPAQFSATRALRHVRALAERPHPIGTPAHDAARNYVMNELQALGLVVEVQDTIGMIAARAGRVQNIIARLNGTARDGKAILLAAHYDGVPAGPAAGDDAAGVAAILETLRALRHGPPLREDVIVLVTDGEEMGLLGADAFVAHHPMAKDVALVMNFEARGTTGRSVMFETGRRNLDVVRMLRPVGDVSASSLMVTIYRNLPNDTDLSMFARLGQPGLNFAFIGGVPRYHTPYDDVAHLNPGSLQHHGQQMLALLQRFGREPLPRPETGDAVFSDLPFVGVVYYPELLAVPLAVLVVLAALVGAWRGMTDRAAWPRQFFLGTFGAVASMLVGVWAVPTVARWVAGVHVANGWDGQPMVQPVYALASALLQLTVCGALWTLARRWASETGAWFGGLVMWSILTVVTAIKLPGASYLFAWPLVGAAALAWARQREGLVHEVNGWAGTLIALTPLVPVIALIGGEALPLDAGGGDAMAVLLALTAWLLAPHLEALLGARRLVGVGAFAVATVAAYGAGLATVRRTDWNPTHASVLAAQGADSGAAWVTAMADASVTGSWAQAVVGTEPVPLGDSARVAADPALSALAAMRGPDGRARPVARQPLALAQLDSLRVTGEEPARLVTMRIVAPPGVARVSVRVRGATMRGVIIDGRAAVPYRGRPLRPDGFELLAPPPAGVPVQLALEGAGAATLEVSSLRYGVDAVALGLPPRPAHVVPAHGGDAAMAVARVPLPPAHTPLP